MCRGSPAHCEVPRAGRCARPPRSDREIFSAGSTVLFPASLTQVYCTAMTVHIPYETSDKPWFGPRRRARELLDQRSIVLPPSEALEAITSILGAEASAIQRVRFIDYVHSGKLDFRYTIALVWTFSHSTLRQALYTKGEELVRATGWYPLPQGERIASGLALHKFRQIINWDSTQVPRIEGELLGIENAVGAEGGCAIRVRLGNASLLLDSGLPGYRRTATEPVSQPLRFDDGGNGGGLSAPSIRRRCARRDQNLLGCSPSVCFAR
jgi:hypothetical protein